MKLASLTSLGLATLLFAATPAQADDETTILRDYPYQSVADLRSQDFQLDASVPGALTDLQVGIYMLHPRRGDVSLTLISPSGTQLQLKRASATDRGRHVGGVFGLNLSSAEALSALQGEELSGTWTLRVADHRRGGVGTLVVWSLHATVADMGTTPTAPTPTGKRFEVIVENLTGAGGFATPLAPGAYALHRGGQPLLGRGLESLAEDGSPSALVDTMLNDSDVIVAGAFNTPDGADEPGPALPGGSYRFEVDAMPGDKLSLATMLAQTNDAFVASPLAGVELFDADGRALDQELALEIYDAGSETNEAPGMGPNQAPRQAGPNTGGAEGGVAPYTDSTRALPLAQQVVRATVRAAQGGLRIRLENVSGGGALVSPITPTLFATHTADAALFTLGERAPRGLESLAEDGDASALADRLGRSNAFGQVEVVGNGPATPGDGYDVIVRPTRTHSHLSLATMIARTNDAFISNAGAVRLVDGNGRLRSARAVEADLNAALAVFDAGTEANEAPGVGPNIAPLQAGPNTGPADADPLVRRYADATNDFAQGWAAVEVRPIGSQGTFEVTIRNTSAGGAFPGFLTSPVAFVHDGSVALFEEGRPAASVLAELAEDGETAGLINALRGLGNRVRSAERAGGSIQAGRELTFRVTADRTRRYLNLASMLVPTNDAFLSLGATGLELVTASGTVRSAAELRADLAGATLVWDAGSEANEAGGAGGGQPPATHEAGPAEGNGRVRVYDDATWQLPAAERLVRVRVRAID